MEEYIPKSALVAEIKRILSAFENSDAPVDRLRASTLISLLSFIDILEVKEMNLGTEQRIKDCPFRTVYCERFKPTIVECNGRCSWVADYPKLKELKAQKGE